MKDYKESTEHFQKIKNKMAIKQQERVGAFIFWAVLAVGFFVSVCLLSLRPSFSATEKRELTKFPALSLEGLSRGGYTKDIENWFSDTFPFRDNITDLNAELENWRGIHPGNIQIHGDVNEGDEIPDAPDSMQPEVSQAEEVSSLEEVSSEAAPKDNAPEQDTQALGAIIIAGDAAYEYYHFDKDVSNSYVRALNETANKLNTAKAYSMIVPNSMDITLNKATREKIKTSDQKKAIAYMQDSLNEKIKPVPVFEALKAHMGEYIYFRTDHHWTALGAYYGYVQFMAQRGEDAKPLDYYTTKDYTNFVGAFYADSGKKPELKRNPDTITTYSPPEKTKLVYKDKSGKEHEWKLISDVSTWTSSAKYSTFIGGDNPYTVITNEDLTEGKSICIVKESYANAMIPFLVPHYKSIYVLDYRSYKGSISEFVNSNYVDELLFVNNISMTRNKSLVSRLAGLK
ncbi:MAG: hypothetical protein LBS74_10770 [Oscillospiraceae bacterium]|jgi:hypothetical protein|nr:hypothetical protein [Oscillospiraceae bacterium]